MIEIRITLDEAVKLLKERMNHELIFRKKDGFINKSYEFENLTFAELLSITEVAVFDTIALLPLDVLTSETNLKLVITKTVQALSHNFNREEYLLYSSLRTDKLLKRFIKESLYAMNKKTFVNN
ncbi:MAG: hypothetical protein M0P71_11855 [Melioribacteraceae bacterium]|nr:hypothetical protein [Melioribacteraceae bacterium]